MSAYKRNGFGDVIPSMADLRKINRAADDVLRRYGQPSGDWHSQIRTDFKNKARTKAYWAEMNKGVA